ncbi:MAG: hypothetical protein EOO52_17075 [Gammaproteobacteria bacterium]|nr:MAG: hypothetical protein EOO52_17075 [Gammaproteobacteria bacterium]
MFLSIRQSPKRLRLWLVTAAVVLLLTSILEAGHGHGVFTAPDDNCILCQHSVALDKILTQSVLIVIPLLLLVFASSYRDLLIPQLKVCSTHIRAPPVQLHAR